MSVENLINNFAKALNGPKGNLDAWLELHNENDVKIAICGYAENLIDALLEERAQLEARGSAEPDVPSKAELDRDLYRNCYNYYENVCERLISEAERYVEALRLIASGEVMAGNYTHADTVLRYQDIARKAIKSTSLLSAPAPPSAGQKGWTHFCNKCGLTGWQQEHAGCNYLAIDYSAKQPNSASPNKQDPAPANTLPDYKECRLRVDNSEYHIKRGSVGDYDSLLANPIHEFIYEYDCSDDYKSAWWRHRLERLIDFVRHESSADQKPPRITEQDAREIFNCLTAYYGVEVGPLDFECWVSGIGYAMLDKLNENREPDYREQEWQPIDTAPKDGSMIWITDGNKITVALWYKGSTENYWKDWFLSSAVNKKSLIAWMPLPDDSKAIAKASASDAEGGK